MSSLPNKLKLFELTVNGGSIGKKVKNVTIPKLTRKMEEFRGGTMTGPIQADLGNELMEMSFVAGGAEYELIQYYAAKTADATSLRFSAAYQSDDTAAINAVEILVRGRIREFDVGAQTAGELGETTITVPCAYYRCTQNGRVLTELDPLNCIEVINGTDMLAEVRAALGLASLGF